jgi:hypothetical protein
MMSMRFVRFNDGAWAIQAEQGEWLCLVPVVNSSEVITAVERAKRIIEDYCEQAYCEPQRMAPRNWPSELPYPFPGGGH